MGGTRGGARVPLTAVRSDDQLGCGVHGLIQASKCQKQGAPFGPRLGVLTHDPCRRRCPSTPCFCFCFCFFFHAVEVGGGMGAVNLDGDEVRRWMITGVEDDGVRNGDAMSADVGGRRTG